MGIKNFTVTTQRVKDKADGLIGYANYLNNEKAPSHKNTKILNIGNNFDDFLKNTIINTMNFDKENKKGGRKVESYAQSFNFILPPEVPNPTHDQWRLIYKDLVLKAKKTLDIKGETSKFAMSCYANIHDQTNPHLNLLIPRIYNKDRLHKLDQKNLLGELKNEFNRSVMQHCNIDFKSYKPNQQNVGKRRKKWQYEQQQSIKAKEELTEERLLLAQDKLDMADLIDQHQQVQERAETAQIKAQEATDVAVKAKADADVAKHEAQQKIGLLAEMKLLFNEFKSSLSGWINSIKSKDELLEEINRNDTISAVEMMQNHHEYDADVEEIVFTAIEQAEIETEKPDISNQVSRSRKRKLTPY
ncbi:hypothetical protein [Pseudomonas aeruginosa]|uniref:hypothetical protein n=1 Tax=Pseudomonas aeruginosa TaxID=287 RepID=UPI0013C4DD1A|nr:hypothetical protein [Pseudomonas aeruginosa]